MSILIGQPEIISGGMHADHRGTISYCNDFTFSSVTRFYTVQPAGLDAVRAWQGHKRENKWFHVVGGAFKVVLVKIDNWESPSDQCETFEYNLQADKPEILHIPGGYANGFKALLADSKLIIFSDFTLQQSIRDEYRYDQNKWFNWHNSENK